MSDRWTDPARIPIGIDAHNRWMDLRLTSIENPHILIVGGSQTGKTTLQVEIAAMAASRGNIVIIIDPKLRFQRPFRHPVTRQPLPHVLVFRSANAARAAMEWHGVSSLLRTEMQLRYEADEESDVSVLKDQRRYPTILLIVDELGTANDFADADWRSRKPDGFKGVTPFREHLQVLHRMGAEARVIVCSANQTAKEDELPAGTRTRVLCGQRIFLGPISEGAQWRMLAGDGIDRPDIPDGQKGAGAVVFADRTPQRFQAAFIDWVNHPEKVYNLAAQGVEKLLENGHIDKDGRLRLAGGSLPRPGEMWGLVASQYYEPAPCLTPTINTQVDEENDADDDVPDASEIDHGTANMPPDEAPAKRTKKREETPPIRMIVGNEAAAEFCHMTVTNFRKRRSMWPIPGEVAKYEKNKPAWPEDKLEMWSLERMETRRTGVQEERSA